MRTFDFSFEPKDGDDYDWSPFYDQNAEGHYVTWVTAKTEALRPALGEHILVHGDEHVVTRHWDNWRNRDQSADPEDERSNRFGFTIQLINPKPAMVGICVKPDSL